MKALFTIATIVIITVKVLCIYFDHASDEVRTQAQDRLNRTEQVAK